MWKWYIWIRFYTLLNSNFDQTCYNYRVELQRDVRSNMKLQVHCDWWRFFHQSRVSGNSSFSEFILHYLFATNRPRYKTSVRTLSENLFLNVLNMKLLFSWLPRILTVLKIRTFLLYEIKQRFHEIGKELWSLAEGDDGAETF